MCCVEIAMTVCGIVVLCTGKFPWFSGTMVTGSRAYLIGGLLTATFPLALVIGFSIGVVIGLSNAGQPINQDDIFCSVSTQMAQSGG